MDNIIFKDGRLLILDQTLLPNEETYEEMTSLDDCRKAIKKLMVRGAPAIGIFAGYAMALFGRENAKRAKAALDSARPTAVNLSWATSRLLKAIESGKDPVAEARAIHNEDMEMCRKISEYGLSLLHDGVIPAGQALVLTAHPGGFDSRYFGLVPLAGLTTYTPFFMTGGR